MAQPRPHVAAALVCEKVLREVDGVATVVRIVDKFTVPAVPDPPTDVKHGFPLTAFVVLKSGDVTGKHPVHLRLHYPSGLTKEVPELVEEFLGQEHGVSYTFQLTLEVKEYGLYWFDVIWDDGTVLTRIPFRLRQAEDTSQQN